MFFLMAVTAVFTVLLGLSPVRYTGILLFFQAFFVTGSFPWGSWPSREPFPGR